MQQRSPISAFKNRSSLCLHCPGLHGTEHQRCTSTHTDPSDCYSPAEHLKQHYHFTEETKGSHIASRLTSFRGEKKKSVARCRLLHGLQELRQAGPLGGEGRLCPNPGSRGQRSGSGHHRSHLIAGLIMTKHAAARWPPHNAAVQPALCRPARTAPQG